MGPESKWPTFQVIVKYFQVVMALVYIVLGAFIIWKGEQKFNLSATLSVPLGVTLIAYGIIRSYRAYQKSL